MYWCVTLKNMAIVLLNKAGIMEHFLNRVEILVFVIQNEQMVAFSCSLCF